MTMNRARRLAVAAMTTVGVFASAGGATASGVRLSVTPAHIRPGGKVVVATIPRRSCRFTMTIAKRSFSHSMRYGWIQIKMPRADIPGRVPVKVSCGGMVATGAFTVSK